MHFFDADLMCTGHQPICAVWADMIILLWITAMSSNQPFTLS